MRLLYFGAVRLVLLAADQLNSSHRAASNAENNRWRSLAAGEEVDEIPYRREAFGLDEA